MPDDHPALAGHFPGNPVVPGVVLLDGVIAGVEATLGQRIVRVHQAKFPAPLRPGVVAVTACEFDSEVATFRVSVDRSGQEVTLATGRLSVHADKS